MPNYVITDLTRQTASILRGLIARYGVTQQQMAEAVGVSQSQLSKMIRGVRPIDLDQLAAMCEALGTSPGVVLGEAESFLAAYMTPNAAKFIYVEEGLRLETPIDVSKYAAQYSDPVVPEWSGRARKEEGQG